MRFNFQLERADKFRMLIDASIVIFLMLQTFLGWRRGLLWQAAGVASLVFGILLGSIFGPALARPAEIYIVSDPFHARMIAFFFVFAVVGFSMRMVAAVAEVSSESGIPPMERDKRRARDRILGGMFGAIKGSILCFVITAMAIALMPSSNLWRGSRLAGPIAAAGARVLPAGAAKEVQRWALQSAADFRKGLDIK